MVIIWTSREEKKDVNDDNKMAQSEVDGQRLSRLKGPVRRQLRSMHQQQVVLLRSPHLVFVSKLRDHFDVREVESWDALVHVLPSAHPTSVVVLDPYEGGATPSAAFWTVLERFPSVAVIPAFKLQPEGLDHMRAMVSAGTSEFLNLDREDTVRIQHPLQRPGSGAPLLVRSNAGSKRHFPAMRAQRPVQS
jgi:hypothetical protein